MNEPQICLIIDESIKLMKLEKFIPNLQEEDFKKIFPQEYYSKYANHLNILDFQQKVLTKPLFENPPIHFQKPKKLHLSNPKIFLTNQKSRVNVSKFDHIRDAIQKNNQEIVRMKHFLKHGNNEKTGKESQHNVIRSPLQGFHELSRNTILTMQEIQNQQHQSQAKLTHRKQSQHVKFILTEKDHLRSRFEKGQNNESYSVGMQSARSVELHPTPNKMAKQYLSDKLNGPKTNHQDPYRGQISQIVQAAIRKNDSLNPELANHSVHYICNLNRCLKQINKLSKNHQSLPKMKLLDPHENKSRARKMSVRYEGESLKAPQDLIEKTQQIRRQVTNLNVESRYNELQRARSLKIFLDRKS